MSFLHRQPLLREIFLGFGNLENSVHFYTGHRLWDAQLDVSLLYRSICRIGTDSRLENRHHRCRGGAEMIQVKKPYQNIQTRIGSGISRFEKHHL